MKNTLTHEDAFAGTVVHVMGEKSFNNDLLCTYLESQTTLPVQILRVENLRLLSNLCTGKNEIVLLDRRLFNASTLATWWVLNANVLNTSTCPTILFNVEVSEGLDREALMKGFRGVVHAHLPIDFYPRALSAVASGELWYPRKVLAQHFLSENMPYRKLLEKNSLLTEREKEILRMLSSGKSNQQIADYLSISQHTVKNHAYNIFKKLNVSNRLEAALWLSNHI